LFNNLTFTTLNTATLYRLFIGVVVGLLLEFSFFILRLEKINPSSGL